MKFLLKLVGAIAAVVVGLILLRDCSDEPSTPLTTPTSSTVTPAPPVSTLATATPATTPVQQAAPGVPPWLTTSAREARVTVAGLQNKDGWWYVTVQGYDRNDLNTFLDVALRSGLKDIDHGYQAYKQFLGPGNRQIFQNTFKVRY